MKNEFLSKILSTQEMIGADSGRTSVGASRVSIKSSTTRQREYLDLPKIPFQ